MNSISQILDGILNGVCKCSQIRLFVHEKIEIHSTENGSDPFDYILPELK